MKIIKTRNSAEDCPSIIPWFLLAGHQEQALKNHGQSLAKLDSRGGCSIQEVYSIITDQPYYSITTERDAINFVKMRISEANHYNYIYFVIEDVLSKTTVWACYASHSDNKLGQIRWYSPWRQYCFLPSRSTVFNVGCMEDINHFISKQTQARKLAKQAEQAGQAS